jgi:hypothetical protein
MFARGVVVAAPFEMNGTMCKIRSATLEPEQLREYLLYWDRIEWPDNNLVSMGSSPEIAVLIDEGIVSRTRVNLGGVSGNIGLAFLAAQAIAFREWTKREPGQWTIAQCSNQFFLPIDGLERKQSVEVDLYRALPIPTRAVPLQDVLEFKQRRSSELAALRAALDELYLEVGKAADIPRARIHAIETLEMRLNELHRVFGEKWNTRMVTSLKVELSAPALVATSVSAAALASTFGLSIPACAALGAVASMIKLEARTADRLANLPVEVRQLAYVKYAQEEL